jgi:FkbM family methyltransferase
MSRSLLGRVRSKAEAMAWRRPPGPPRFAAQDPAHSAWLANTIWAGEYDRRGYVPRRGWRVVDIGANVGVFAVLSASRGATVTAYEPHPATFEYLVQNASGYNVECRQFAVVPERVPETSLILSATGTDTRHSVLTDQTEWGGDPSGESVTVPALTLEEAIGAGCDLVKLDCEGIEFALLEATPLPVLRRVKRWVCELHGQAAAMEAFEERLRAAGFRSDRHPLERPELAMCYAR